MLAGGLESVDCGFDFFRHILGNDLLGNDEIKNLTAGLLVEELDGVFHQVRCLRFDNLDTFFVRKAVFYGHASEIHDGPPFLRFADSDLIYKSEFVLILAHRLKTVNLILTKDALREKAD